MEQLVTTPADTGVRPWSGYYINLDRAVDRRRSMEAQLARHDLSGTYARFSAVDGAKLGRASPRGAGEVGIFRSHLDVLGKVAASDRPAHIVEDDVVFSDLTLPATEAMLGRHILRQFDLVLHETYVGVSISTIRKFHSAFNDAMLAGPITRADQLQVVDISAGYQNSLASYMVSPASARRLVRVLEEEWARGPTVAVDSVIRREANAGRLRIACIFPFVTTVDVDLSWTSEAGRLREIAGRPLLELLLRYAFYVRRDLPGYAMPKLRQVLDRLPPPPRSDETDLFAAIVDYYLRSALNRPPSPGKTPKVARPD